ncbi:conserved hypothetical protein [mine drainage metagenome]|jgi:uncharacterized membrane protein HdeD (DUF308 family)|uniref:Uncharacterized protein n=1 Tax=mine drainage metagenome TaxID=410659 RepID=E6QRX2_9ZZZZ
MSHFIHKPMKTLHTIGVITTWISIIVCALGIVLGLWHLVVYHETNDWWTAVPASFLGLLSGVVLTLFSKP